MLGNICSIRSSRNEITIIHTRPLVPANYHRSGLIIQRNFVREREREKDREAVTRLSWLFSFSLSTRKLQYHFLTLHCRLYFTTTRQHTFNTHKRIIFFPFISLLIVSYANHKFKVTAITWRLTSARILDTGNSRSTNSNRAETSCPTSTDVRRHALHAVVMAVSCIRFEITRIPRLIN